MLRLKLLDNHQVIRSKVPVWRNKKSNDGAEGGEAVLFWLITY